MKQICIDLSAKFKRFAEPWLPRVIAEMNDPFKLAKYHGSFVWHHVADTDDVWVVVAGEMGSVSRDRTARLASGQLPVVPKGVANTGESGEVLTAPNNLGI